MGDLPHLVPQQMEPVRPGAREHMKRSSPLPGVVTALAGAVLMAERAAGRLECLSLAMWLSSA